MNPIRLIIFLTAALASTGIAAIEILDATVDENDGVYHAVGSSLITASPEFVYATLMDFDNFHKLSGGLKETRFVASEVPGERLAYTLIEACVLFFCRQADSFLSASVAQAASAQAQVSVTMALYSVMRGLSEQPVENSAVTAKIAESVRMMVSFSACRATEWGDLVEAPQSLYVSESILTRLKPCK